MEARKDKVVALLSAEGNRLGSTVLSSLSVKVMAYPFIKVKKLIQELIERFVAEATAEATKKGFCDLELSKAEKNRNHRWQDVQRLNAELSGLEAKRDELEEELSELAAALKELNAALEEATKLRAESKEENLTTLKEAKEGLGAVKEALTVLKVFYKKSAKATVLLQASPVDEDDPGAASGAYKGNQQASKAVLGGKTTKTELNEQDLDTTKTSITEKSKDMQTNMDLVDKALEELEELKPLCIDTGMSYKERVEKREEEIDALKRALCILDTDGVEDDCAGK